MFLGVNAFQPESVWQKPAQHRLPRTPQELGQKGLIFIESSFMEAYEETRTDSFEINKHPQYFIQGV
jgi:hypothetical protein